MKKRSSNPAKALSAEELLLDLANLPDKGASQFREKWKRWYWRYTEEDLLTRRDELRLFWTHGLWEYPKHPEHLEEPYEFTASDELRPSKEERRKRKEQFRKREAERQRWGNEWYSQHPEALRPTVPKRAKKLYANWADYFDQEMLYGEGDTTTLEETICAHWLKSEPVWWRVVWEKNRKSIAYQPSCLPAMLAGTCLRVVERLGYCRNPKCARPYFFLQRRDQLYCSPECAKPARRASKLRWWHERRGRKSEGIMAGPEFLSNPGRVRHSPLRPPLKGRNKES